jgi:16S rRNA processing protein RimM
VEVVVATVARPHGVKGAVALRCRTDRPESRFLPEALFAVRSAGGRADLPGQLTLRSVTRTQSAYVATFAEVRDREAAEALRGADLIAQVDPAEEADGWYAEQLRGARVTLPDGTPVGILADLVNGPGQDWLRITQADGSSALVPFVSDLVPQVDQAAGLIVVDPPAGLVAARPDAAPDGAPDGAPDAAPDRDERRPTEC